MAPKDKLIVALDIADKRGCLDMISKLAGEVDIFKVGIIPFTAFGSLVLETLSDLGKKVFLDLKFHDIPNTVYGAASAASGKKIFMMNFHCRGGMEMLKEAARGARSGAIQANTARPILLGVTILTSDGVDAGNAGSENNREIEKEVLRMAKMAKEAGMDGVVASAFEAASVKEYIGKDFIVVTPGIRPAGYAKGDQKRVVGPKEAIKRGADYIVVGRPVFEAPDPVDAVKRILDEMASVL